MRLIDADSLLQKFKDKSNNPNYRMNMHNIWSFINNASTVGKRKVGEWCKQNDDYFDWYECSECGYGSEGEMQYSSEHDVRTNFCPCCGAEMRGNENG